MTNRNRKKGILSMLGLGMLTGMLENKNKESEILEVSLVNDNPDALIPVSVPAPKHRSTITNKERKKRTRLRKMAKKNNIKMRKRR